MMREGISPGNVPVYYGGGKIKSIEKKLKVIELALRFVIVGLGVLAAALVGLDSQVRVIFTIEKKAKFTDMKALVFLVIANGIAAGYSLIQGLRCVVSMVRGSVLFSKGLAWAIFSFDQGQRETIYTKVSKPGWDPTLKSKQPYCGVWQLLYRDRIINSLIPHAPSTCGGCKSYSLKPNDESDHVMAYVTLAALAAAAQSAVLGQFGQPQLQWMKICNLYGKFCTQVGEGLVSSFIVSLSMVALSCVSAFNLFRLYGGNKGKNSGSW